MLFFTLLQLAVILAAARTPDQPAAAAAVGELVAGLLLGPSLLAALASETLSLGVSFHRHSAHQHHEPDRAAPDDQK